MLNEIANFIKEVGFPVAVASFVLFRLNGKLDRLTQALHKIIELVERSQQQQEE